MEMNSKLLEIHSCVVNNYEPLVDYGTWRVAAISSPEGGRADSVKSVHKHNETDEVFLLLKGRGVLFIGEGGERVEAFHAVEMEALTLYNVKRGVWHASALESDSIVLAVENRDTTRTNSEYLDLPSEARRQISDAYRQATSK